MDSKYPRRRVPLLGKDSPNVVKCQRAFTVKADQRIWDIGKPETKHLQQFIKNLSQEKASRSTNSKDAVSLFHIMLNSGALPFLQDHSCRMHAVKLKWTIEIQCIDLEQVLWVCLLGLMTNSHIERQMAFAALNDILLHSYPQDICKVVTAIVDPVHRITDSADESAMRLSIIFLKSLFELHPGTVPILMPHIKDLFRGFNSYLKNFQNLNGGIDYKQQRQPSMADCVEGMLTTLVDVSGNHVQDLRKQLKDVIPIFAIRFQGMK